MNVLFVEDDDFKLTALIETALATLPSICVTTARSFTMAAQLVKRSHYDLIVLDMSLPTYDATEKTEGGDAQGFGGRRIVRIAEEYGNSSPTILVTQYATYEEPGERMTVSELAEELSRELETFFVGTVGFDRAKEGWIEEFQNLIKKAARL